MKPLPNPDPPPFKSTWMPHVEWIFAIPIKLPNQTEGKIIIPDRLTTKPNAGIVVKVGADIDKDWVGLEVLFPPNAHYEVEDKETNEIFYIIKADLIITSRVPPPIPQFFQVSKGKTLDLAEPEVATLQHSDQETRPSFLRQ